jgi:threonine dehydratase
LHSVPTIHDIYKAQKRLAQQAVDTPLLRSPKLDQKTGATVFIKPENLQRTGSFKFRGAYNAMVQIADADKTKGVVAVSSGNHAQAVAEAGQILDIPVIVVMPHDAPKAKIEGVWERNAEIVFYDRNAEDREQIAAQLIKKTGATYVPPYDHLDVIAGQGTAGLEAAEELKNQGVTPDIFLCCCGGGGLMAGMSIALKDAFPELEIYAVEPEEFDDTGRSLRAGKRLENTRKSGSICDAILTPMPGKITFEINRLLVSGGLTVTDDEALEAVRFAAQKLKMVVEPGGAVALAALLANKLDIKGKTVLIILSGGNTDLVGMSAI